MNKESIMRGLIQLISISILLSVLFSCKDGPKDNPDNSDPGGDSTSTGKFIDSAVQGLQYSTIDHSGNTNTNGEFQYNTIGEAVIFSFSDLPIGTAPARDVVTPYDLSSGFQPDDVEAFNIALFLQSLDVDQNPDNGIVLMDSSTVALPDNIDFSRRDDVEQALTNAGISPRTMESVESHLESTMGRLASNMLTPGSYEVTTYRTLRWNYENNIALPSYAISNEACAQEFTDVTVNVTDSEIVGSYMQISNNQLHTFNLPFGDGLGGVTDNGNYVSLRFKESPEYGILKTHRGTEKTASTCYHVFRLNRVGGLNIPPRGWLYNAASGYNTHDGPTFGTATTISNTYDQPLRPTLCGDELLTLPPSQRPIGGTCHPVYFCDSVEGDDTFVFKFEDDDGWITEATVEWSSEAGGGGVIDLLAESQDVEHFANGKIYWNNIVQYGSGDEPVVVAEEWIKLNLNSREEEYDATTSTWVTLPDVIYNVKEFESNPSELWGAFVVRGQDPMCHSIQFNPNAGTPGYYYGPVTLTLRLTDNEGYTFSKSYTINQDGGASAGSGAGSFNFSGSNVIIRAPSNGITDCEYQDGILTVDINDTPNSNPSEPLPEGYSEYQASVTLRGMELVSEDGVPVVAPINCPEQFFGSTQGAGYITSNIATDTNNLFWHFYSLYGDNPQDTIEQFYCQISSVSGNQPSISCNGYLDWN